MKRSESMLNFTGRGMQRRATLFIRLVPEQKQAILYIK